MIHTVSYSALLPGRCTEGDPDACPFGYTCDSGTCIEFTFDECITSSTTTTTLPATTTSVGSSGGGGWSSGSSGGGQTTTITSTTVPAVTTTTTAVPGDQGRGIELWAGSEWVPHSVSLRDPQEPAAKPVALDDGPLDRHLRRGLRSRRRARSIPAAVNVHSGPVYRSPEYGALREGDGGGGGN